MHPGHIATIAEFHVARAADTYLQEKPAHWTKKIHDAAQTNLPNAAVPA